MSKKTIGLPPWFMDKTVEWTYKRESGDLIVYASSKDEALRTIQAHGFTSLNPDMLVRTGMTLRERLATEQQGEIK